MIEKIFRRHFKKNLHRSMRARIYCFYLLMLLLPYGADAGEMVLIPAGSFLMGSEEGEMNERPEHSIHLNGYYMDRYPVTNAEYAQFLNACGNQVEEGVKWLDTDSILSWALCKIKKVDNRFSPRQGFDHHPVVKVSWFGARAYARWVGKRLPTEAEWEKAARGGFDGKRYVYGDTLRPEQANIKGYYSSTPVDFYPPNGYGIYMVVAGVWQWCSDWYDPEYYSRSPSKNPQGPETGSLKVLRGGSWFHPNSWRVATRGDDFPASWKYCFVTGFRCVKDLERAIK
jgi:formylglycine-generating enzyme required for sulfatase activity